MQLDSSLSILVAALNGLRDLGEVNFSKASSSRYKSSIDTNLVMMRFTWGTQINQSARGQSAVHEGE